MFGLVLTIVVLLAVAAAILLFERPRAEQIERDLHEQAADRRERRDPDPGSGPDLDPDPDQSRGPGDEEHPGGVDDPHER